MLTLHESISVGGVILKAESKGFSDGLDMGCETEESTRIPKFCWYVWRIRMTLPWRGMWNTTEGALGRRVLNFHFRQFIVEKSTKHPNVAIKEAIKTKCGLQKKVWAKKLTLSVISLSDI